MKIPKEQRDKLESFIKHWINPSEWYEWREEGYKMVFNGSKTQ